MKAHIAAEFIGDVNSHWHASTWNGGFQVDDSSRDKQVKVCLIEYTNESDSNSIPQAKTPSMDTDMIATLPNLFFHVITLKSR